MSGIDDSGEFAAGERFRILRRLGEGGIGVVYEALDQQRQERVAIKTLRNMSADGLLGLKREFRSLQDVQHPNLVSLGELFEEGGHWFFTMELVGGQDFLSYVRAEPIGELAADISGSSDTWRESPARRLWAGGKPFSEERLRAALGQLVLGVSALHTAGQVHRDIKPSNILVTPEGRAVLLDFGFVTHSSSGQASDLKVVGTITYMAPEQAASRAGAPPADWYSVGVLLYEALTGRVPHEGAPLEVLMAKQDVDPPAPRTLVSGVPEDLDALCMELLARDPTARPAAPQILKRLGVRVAKWREAQSSVTLSSRPFVGREAELATLTAAFEEILSGGGVSVLVHGESGVGKSALVRRFTETLSEPRTVVLTGRCFEQESVPYKGFDGVVDALSRYMSRPQVDAHALLPRAPALIGRVFPVLRRVRAIAEAPRLAETKLEPQELRTRVFAGMRELFSRMADRNPVVIVIDDLQWADADSLSLLAEIQRQPDAPALLVVATYRGTDPPRELLGKKTRRLLVGGLPMAEARTLAEALLEQSTREGGPRPVVSAQAIADEADGHPLFIDELVRHAARGHSGTVRLDEALRARIAELPEPAGAILELVAVAGARLPQELVAQAAGLELSELARWVTQLRAGNYVRTSGSRASDAIEPYHDRIRVAVLMGLSDVTRANLHRELALALEALGRTDAELLALHWRGAGDEPRAARWSRRAAADAEEALAFDHAAELYRIALGLAGGEPDLELRVRLGDALANAGRGPESAQEYLAAAAIANGTQAIDLQRRAAEQYLRAGHIDEGLETIRAVLATIGMKLPETPGRALLSLLLARARLRLRGLSFKRRDLSQIPAEELAKIDICSAIGVGLGMVDSISGAAFQTRALLLALKAGERTRVGRAIAVEATFVCTAGVGSGPRTTRLLAAADALAAEVKNALLDGWVLGCRGVASYMQGQFQDALGFLERAVTAFRDCVGAGWEIETTQLTSLWTLYYLGQWAELERRVSAVSHETFDRGDLYGSTNVALGPPNITWLMLDDPAGARRVAAEALQRWKGRGFQVQHWWELMCSSQIDIYEGNPDAALARLASSWRPLARSMLLRVQMVHVEALWLRAQAALAAAHQPGRSDALRLVAQAERDARRLAGLRAPWTAGLVAQLRACAASARGDHKAAAAGLAHAERLLGGAHMTMHAAAARRRRGELLGGEAGAALVTEADQLITRQNVKHPAAMTALLVPGSPVRRLLTS